MLKANDVIYIPVWVALVYAVPQIVGLTLQFINNLLVRRAAEHAKEIKISMAELEKNTNGIAEKLLKVTGESEFARGHLEGSREEKDKGER